MEENIKNKIKFVKEFVGSSLLNVVFLNNDKQILFINEAAGSNLKISISELKGLNFIEFLKSFFKTTDNLSELSKKNGKLPTLIRGQEFYEVQMFPVTIDKIKVGYVLVFHNVTAKQKDKLAALQEDTFLSQIIKFIPDMLIVTDREGKIIVWNKAAEEMTGVKKELMLGKDNHEYAIPIYGKRKPFLLDVALSGKIPEGNNYSSLEYKGDTVTAFTNKATLKGKNRILWGKATRFYDFEGNVLGAIEVIRDVTRIKHMESELRNLAERDPLTNLFNRRQLVILLNRELNRSKREKSCLTVFYIDADNLKEINDKFGHSEGDKMLMNIAEAFKKSLRKIDIISRVGGDEFVVVTPGLNRKNAKTLINRVRNKLKKLDKGKPYKIEFSYGVFEFNPAIHNISLEGILVEADKEMYKMKSHKKKML